MYTIHDNGARPCTVHVCDDRVDLRVADAVIWGSPYTRVFVGDNCFERPRYAPYGAYPGNTILIELPVDVDCVHRYVHIGRGAFTFETRRGDRIESYASPVGNNDVPYPFAIGQKYVYYLLDCVTLPIGVLSDVHAGYDEFYTDHRTGMPFTVDKLFPRFFVEPEQ